MPAHLRLFLSAEQIEQRVKEMGSQIATDYPGGGVYLIGILKGACIFLSDLCRAIPVNTKIEFIGTSSYGRGKTTSGEVKLSKDLDVSIENEDVILVEDIVDTGLTSRYLLSVLRSRGAASVELCTLLDKTARRIVPIHPTYAGFECPDSFVVGYGLDFSERYRNLPDILQVDDLAALRADPDALASYAPPAA